MSSGGVDILILGAGWTSIFLVRSLERQKISYALTTTTGKMNKACEPYYENDAIIQFAFQPDTDPEAGEPNEDYVEEQYTRLPRAKTVIVTFKLEGKGQSAKLMRMYSKTHTHLLANFIQLGSTGIYKEAKLHDRHSEAYEKTSRAIAEDEFIEEGGSVLALAGLWGAERVPWNWVKKIANTKEKLAAKQALHLIHGADVAKACIAMHKNFYPGERYIITDGRVYDWWELIDWWADSLTDDQAPDGSRLAYRQWLTEVKHEAGVPGSRSHEVLGRVLDSDAFWKEQKTRPDVLLTRKTKELRDQTDHTSDTVMLDTKASMDAVEHRQESSRRKARA